MYFSKLLKATLICTFTILCFTSQAQNESFIITPIGPNFLLDKPWDLHYGPEGYLWVTERQHGKVVRINPENASRDELIQIPDLHSSAGQDGLLGMALHDGILDDNPYVYLSYTHLVQGQRKQKLVRYTYQVSGDDGSLSSPIILIDNLPASNDHNSGRLVFGPDQKLYYTIGDQGGNQGSGNYCNPILSQILPTQQEIDQQNWSNYPGKILRLNTDGSIPDDNPVLEGVRSHIYSYGHRNAQGIVFGSNGLLYADEHGPNTDDEVNIIYSGKNYGWPNVVGYQDDQAYDYCNWSSAPNCQSLNYSSSNCHSSITLQEESSFSAPNYQEPLLPMFNVPDNYNYNDPACSDSWICRPNVAPSSIEIYESDAIPSWKNSLLVSSLKRGRIYRLKLDETGTAVVGDTVHQFYTTNRYRDIVADPDGKSFYVITDESGKTSDASGYNVTTNIQNPGTILKFTLDESVSVSNPTNENLFQVWPNPASQGIFFELKGQSIANDAQLQLINAQGEIVKNIYELHDGTNEINASGLPPGFYIIRLFSKNRSWQQRVIVQ